MRSIADAPLNIAKFPMSFGNSLNYRAFLLVKEICRKTHQASAFAMKPATHDLHGNVPEKSGVALLLIDAINDLEFEGGGNLLKPALRMAQHLRRLKLRSSALGIPAVYVNDNFGRWSSDFRVLIDHCLRVDVRGRPIAELLQPEKNDYFVLKPKHSGFFSTTLELLLKFLGASTLILGGMTTDNCVLFTASDAFLREYHLFVPADCVAASSARSHRASLQHMRRVLQADIRNSTALNLRKLLEKARLRPPV